MRLTVVAILGVIAAFSAIAAARPASWHWDLPQGIAPPPVPSDNPMTAAKVELGRRLFYEADLSIDGTMACATCHSQRHAFADDNRTRGGVHGDPGLRNVPGLANIGWSRPLTWADPRLTTLEAQAAVPVLGEQPIEMGMKGNEAELARRLRRDPCYVRMFRAAFPETKGAIDMGAVTKALAAFQRTLIAFDTPFDRYRRGKVDAMSASAKRGANLFHGRAACAGCHAGPNFTDNGFHALEPFHPDNDRGLGAVTGRLADDYKFRTPGLRNVASTGPYMHDGESRTLEDAIRRHGQMAPDPGLTDMEMADLIAFLDTLTDLRFIANPRLTSPVKACGRRL